MYRRKIILTGVAIFAIGVAFAAQSSRSDRRIERLQQVEPWVPGTNMLMSAHESSVGLAPPR